MKECWINVYSNGHEQWQGWAYPEPYSPPNLISAMVIYRIHVRLK